MKLKKISASVSVALVGLFGQINVHENNSLPQLTINAALATTYCWHDPWINQTTCVTYGGGGGGGVHFPINDTVLN